MSKLSSYQDILWREAFNSLIRRKDHHVVSLTMKHKILVKEYKKLYNERKNLKANGKTYLS